MEHSEGSPHQDDNTHYYLLDVIVRDSVTLQELYFKVWKRSWNRNTRWDQGIRISSFRLAPPQKSGDPTETHRQERKGEETL